MKAKAPSKFWSSLRAVRINARSVINSDADISEPMRQVNKITKGFTLALITILFTVIFTYLAGAILAAPGLLPGLVAQILAQYCVSSGQCDLSTLLPAFAIAVIILTDLVIYLLTTVLLFADQPEDDVIDTISERIVSLGDSLEARMDDLEDLIKDKAGKQ